LNNIINKLRPTNANDRFVVRQLPGGRGELEVVLNALPSHWTLEHVALSFGNDACAVVFCRDPAQAKPGDFDYFEPSTAD
jgi:hypothetical protein